MRLVTGVRRKVAMRFACQWDGQSGGAARKAVVAVCPTPCMWGRARPWTPAHSPSVLPWAPLKSQHAVRRKHISLLFRPLAGPASGALGAVAPSPANNLGATPPGFLWRDPVNLLQGPTEARRALQITARALRRPGVERVRISPNLRFSSQFLPCRCPLPFTVRGLLTQAFPSSCSRGAESSSPALHGALGVGSHLNGPKITGFVGSPRTWANTSNGIFVPILLAPRPLRGTLPLRKKANHVICHYI